MNLEPLAFGAGIWPVVPPILAVVLSLLTREVVFSLFAGAVLLVAALPACPLACRAGGRVLESRHSDQPIRSSDRTNRQP